MSETSNIKALVVLCSLFVAGGLGGAGYAGFKALDKQLKDMQDQTQRVVVDLSSELIGEIEKAQLTPSGDQIESGKDQKEIRETLAQLRTAIETLSERQMAINETLEKKKPVELPKENLHTVYFQMAKSDGEDVDLQIAEALNDLTKYASRPDCAATINGYADTLGRDSANLELSRKRAQYVAAKVRDAKITVTDVQAWGERRLETHTFDGVDNPHNRRVEIDLECKGPEPDSMAAS